jgi:hypothetical protein
MRKLVRQLLNMGLIYLDDELFVKLEIFWVHNFCEKMMVLWLF